MYSSNSQLPSRCIGTPDFVIERPSDHCCFHFETYCFGPGQWGYNLWMANGRRDQETSDTDWKSEESVKRFLEDTIECWYFDPELGSLGGWQLNERDLQPRAPGF